MVDISVCDSSAHSAQTAKPSEACECLDVRGLRCPEPLMLLHQRIRSVPAGARLQILVTDPLAERDIRDFCRHLGHELLAVEKHGEEYHFLLCKRG